MGVGSGRRLGRGQVRAAGSSSGGRQAGRQASRQAWGTRVMSAGAVLLGPPCTTRCPTLCRQSWPTPRPKLSDRKSDTRRSAAWWLGSGWSTVLPSRQPSPSAVAWSADEIEGTSVNGGQVAEGQAKSSEQSSSSGSSGGGCGGSAASRACRPAHPHSAALLANALAEPCA